MAFSDVALGFHIAAHYQFSRGMVPAGLVALKALIFWDPPILHIVIYALDGKEITRTVHTTQADLQNHQMRDLVL